MKKKHLVIVCASLGGLGAVALVTRHHIKELSKYYRLSVISELLPDEKIDEVNYIQIKSYSFNLIGRFCHVPNELSFVLLVKKRLFQLQHELKIDCLLCHSHAIAALAAKPLFLSELVPYALVVHGDIFERPEGVYDPLLTRFYKYVTPVAYQYASSIISLSPYMKEWIIKAGGKQSIIEVIPNGIEFLSCDKPTGFIKAERHQTGLSLLFVGRLSVEKGLDVLLNACKILAERKINFNLSIIGDGPNKVKYTKLTQSLSLNAQVNFLGFLPRQAIYAYYQQADIVCVPSISDPLPTVVLEAMAVGRVVVGSDTGGISYMVIHKQTGLLFKPNSVRQLVDAIDYLSTNPHSLSQMAKNAKVRVAEEFVWSKVGLKIRQAIDACINPAR